MINMQLISSPRNNVLFMRTSLSPGATLSILSTYSLALSCLPLSHRYIPALYSAWSQQAQWRHMRLYVGIYIHVQVSTYMCFPQRKVSGYPPSLPALLSNSLSGGACTQEKQPLIKNERTHAQPTVLLVLHLSGYETTYVKAAAAWSQTEDQDKS